VWPSERALPHDDATCGSDQGPALHRQRYFCTR
jgi:hypothetical protein